MLVNYKTGAKYRLVPLDDNLHITEKERRQIVRICNQPAIYDLLFAERLAGVPYAETDAERFVTWGQRGWREQTHFVFLILIESSPREVAGALDIKSAQKEAAEIGYWLSAEHTGVMTNTVKELMEFAGEAGYQSLYALVRQTNTRSASVLLRNGFTLSEEFEKNGRGYYRFTVSLT